MDVNSHNDGDQVLIESEFNALNVSTIFAKGWTKFDTFEMEAEKSHVLKFIGKSQEPVPQYVLGCLPAIATIGLRHGRNLSTSEYREGIPYRPVGVHAMKIDQVELMNLCVAKASVMERMSSLVSLYYILVGIFAGLTRMAGPSACEDWPYIPMALSWTIPAIYRRKVRSNIIVSDPRNILGEQKIIVKKLDHINKSNQFARVAITALFSIGVPWISVLIAYFIPPISYGGITFVCSGLVEQPKILVGKPVRKFL
ncbi:2951_t:CDS:2 [Funneliformis mosseae]|uniref:2951_t:CDS:1 n=1 Tax=Funneliformis mosseae TaxID=27381 RepID=A0A9N9EKC4_FUNMO|nr:2951_t:CDS:2 [Funneliformis mosseae]